MEKLKNLANPIIAKIIFLAAIICLIVSPILGFALAKVPVYETGFDAANGNKKTTLDNSTDTLSQCFIMEFTLSKDQVCYVEISVPYENITVNIIFVSKAKYLTEAAEENPPTTLNPPSTTWGIRFLSSVFNTYDDPAPDGMGSLQLIVGDYHYLEFMGNGGGDDIYTRPGEYVIIIWGENAAMAHPSSTAVSFDMTVHIEGPGDLLSQIFAIVGSVLLVIVGIFAIAMLLEKARVRRR